MIPLRQLPAFDVVAAGKKAVCTLDGNIELYRIELRFGNAAAAPNEIDDVVEDIVVKFGAKPQRIHTGGQLDHLNRLNGVHYGAKHTGVTGEATRVHRLPIWFANPWRESRPAVVNGQLFDQRLSPAWTLKRNGQPEGLQIEVKFKDGLGAPFLDGVFEALPANPAVEDIGLIQKVYRDTVSAVGTYREIQTLDRVDMYEAIHFLPTVGGTPRYVKEVTLTRNSFDEYEKLTLDTNRARLIDWGLNPDNTDLPWFELVHDHTDRINDGMNAAGVSQLKVRVDWNDVAGGTMDYLTQRTGRPD